ncbi:aldo/keto reductase [Hyphomonas sp. WL0036]|nr:aldo/keto reductase [Hyphomonas sediminis]MBY9067523.1 aldo/keto reductase [Hyphomonas sediminis]
MRDLGKSGLKTAPLVLGGNVFGWTADEATSHTILDAFVDAGFNAVDTANVYSRWMPGHQGGESETVIGNWFATGGGRREKTLLITKAGSDMGEGGKGLKADYIVEACEASLNRLKTDHIDLYFSHFPDAETPIEETLEGHYRLIKAGKIRACGGSNYDAPGLDSALRAAGGERARYEVLQPHYNLLVREQYEGALEEVCAREGLGVIPYFSLASGFLTGKYRTEADLKKSMRGGQMKALLTGRGPALLAAMDGVAARHNASLAQVALAWLMAKPSITAPIASATSVAQLQEIMPAANVKLSAEDMQALDAA